jgi:hypothetical protein
LWEGMIVLTEVSEIGPGHGGGVGKGRQGDGARVCEIG